LNITVFKCHDVIMVYHNIFYINSTNTYLKIKYFKLLYLVDIYKKLLIAMNFFGWSGVSNTPKLP
jgi:hypothetical protein